VPLPSKRHLVPVVAVTGPDGPVSAAALVERFDRRAESVTLLRVAGGDGAVTAGRRHEQSGTVVISAATSAELVHGWSTA
jgi:hypothetical protein